MAEVTSLQVGRFQRLGRRSAEVWQVGVFRLPMWIANQTDPDLPPTRGIAVVCRSVRTGLVNLGMLKSLDAGAVADTAMATCLEFGLKWQHQLQGRASTIHVVDHALHEALEARREQLDADIVLVPALPDIADVLREMEADAYGFVRPDLLRDGALERARVRSFAEAAAAFYRAAPWRWLDNEDVVVIEAPKPPKGMSHITVLGAGGEQFGLGFFGTRAAFERVARGQMPDHAFGVTYGPIDEMPFGDVDLWEDDGLPVAGPMAYPVPAELRRRGDMRRPTAIELTTMEACLRALAQVTGDELDSGRWTTVVETGEGPLSITLALPDVIAELEAPLPASDPAEHLLGRAAESEGRVRVALARRALAIDPDCGDAWLVLASAAPTVNEAVTCARNAVAAARRGLGEAAFSDARGSFWLAWETRPYMRAMGELAQTLRDAGDTNAAIDTWQEMLRLNPNDNQGVRYVLMFAFLTERRHADFAALVQKYPDERDVSWQYCQALWAFSRDGATAESDALLLKAHAMNVHVLPYLVGRKELPLRLPERFRLGSHEEAVLAADVLIPVIERLEGCEDWVFAQSRLLSAEPATRQRGSSSPPKRRKK